jgi:hypothetical protein
VTVLVHIAFQPCAEPTESEKRGISMQSIRPLALAATMALAALAGAVLTCTPARAQTYDPNYPVCLQVYQSMVDYYFDCSYTSMAQCAASASGRNAECVVNPYYAKPQAKPAPRRKRSPRQ